MTKVTEIASIVLKNGEVLLLKATAAEILSDINQDEDKLFETDSYLKVNRVFIEPYDSEFVTIRYRTSNELAMYCLNPDDILAVYDGDYELMKLRNNHLHQQL